MRKMIIKGAIAAIALAGVTSVAPARTISVWGQEFTVNDEAPSPAFTTPAPRDRTAFMGTASGTTTHHHLRRVILPTASVLPRP